MDDVSLTRHDIEAIHSLRAGLELAGDIVEWDRIVQTYQRLKASGDLERIREIRDRVTRTGGSELDIVDDVLGPPGLPDDLDAYLARIDGLLH